MSVFASPTVFLSSYPKVRKQEGRRGRGGGLRLTLLEQTVSSEIQLCKCDKHERDRKR